MVSKSIFDDVDVALCLLLLARVRYDFTIFVTCNYRKYARDVQRSFDLYYNPYTQSVEVLDTTDAVARLVTDTHGKLLTVANALTKLD